MTNVTPQGSVYLCKTPLENDYKNQLTFANANEQLQYFSSTVFKTYTEFTYVKKDRTITVHESIDNIRSCNYMYYRNTGFSNRIFYCFITDMEYVSEESTRITFETDCFQTYYFDIQYKPCFVEREHVSDDTIGKHTVPEGLETGDYVINDMRKIPMYVTEDPSSDFVICFSATKLPYENAGWFSTPYNNIGGVFTSQYMFAVTTLASAKNVIKVYEDRNDGTSEAIQNVYMIPRCCVDETEHEVWSSTNVGGGVWVYQINQLGWTSPKYTLEEPKALDTYRTGTGYVPRNAKLYTYPYSYFYIDNNGGSNIEYRWEDFPNVTSSTWSTSHPKVEYYKALIPSPSVSGKLFFDNYKHYDTAQGRRTFNYGVPFAKIPICAWSTDYYTNWLTQNGLNMGSSLGLGIGSAIGGLGVMTINPIMGGMMTLSGIEKVMSVIGQTHKAKTTPDQAHGDSSCGDFTFAYDRCAMNFYMMSVRQEYAKIIDDYFTMFGYKVNEVKTPSITGRTYWNYVKTIDCNCEGDIPQEDLQIIRKMFNNGCTFWHGASNMYNYNLNNSIVVS